jgi:hypothetical protein
MVIGSNRVTMMSIDIWEATRPDTSSSFPTPEQTYLGAVNSANDDQDPEINSDGLRLYLAPYDPITMQQRVVVATRTSRTSNFGAPTVIAELDGPNGDADPTISPDELIILFSSNRTATPLQVNVWYATRDSANDPFGPPRIVPGINTDANEGDPHLSSDGCRLYFGSDRNSADYYDVFVSEMQ